MATRRKPQSVYQYEPLITPSRWTGEERQLVQRLTQIVDDLYGKVGKLQARLKELEDNKNASI